jgi:hypothetical protein
MGLDGVEKTDSPAGGAFGVGGIKGDRFRKSADTAGRGDDQRGKNLRAMTGSISKIGSDKVDACEF